MYIASDTELAVIPLDQRKAFDRVEYLFKVISIYGFDKVPVFLNSEPYSSQYYNHMTSKVTTKRGTRQGCPLSPPYILAEKTLATCIKTNIKYKRTTSTGNERFLEISSYADDNSYHYSTRRLCCFRI